MLCGRLKVWGNTVSNDATTTHTDNAISLSKYRHAHQLCNYWKGLRSERSIPLRSAFRPQSIINLLPFLILLEHGKQNDAFSFRVIGTAIEGILPGIKTGARLSTINKYDANESIRPNGLKTITCEQSVFFEDSLSPLSNLPVPEYGMIMLPFSTDGERCDLVMGLFDFKSSIKDQS